MSTVHGAQVVCSMWYVVLVLVLATRLTYEIDRMEREGTMGHGHGRHGRWKMGMDENDTVMMRRATGPEKTKTEYTRLGRQTNNPNTW